MFKVEEKSLFAKVIDAYEKSDKFKCLAFLNCITVEAKQFIVFGSHLSLKMTTSEFAQAGALTNQDQALAKAEEDDPTSCFQGFAQYPSIYFFDLTDKKLGWEILGGKDFISIDDDKVLYRRNDGVIELT